MKAGRLVAASFSLPRAQEGATPVGTLHCMQVVPEWLKRILLESTSTGEGKVECEEESNPQFAF